MTERIQQKILIAKQELEQAIKTSKNVDAKRIALEKAIDQLEQAKTAEATNSKLIDVQKSVENSTKQTTKALIDHAEKLITQQKATEASVLAEIKQAVSQLIPVLEKLPEGFSVDIPETNIDGQSVIVSNIENLEKLLTDISKKINKAPEVKVENSQDLTHVNKTFDHIQTLLQKISDKKTEVLVNKEIDFPVDPRDAIPVVLVDKDRKAFYDAIMNVVGGGGGVQARLIKNDRVKVDLGGAEIDASIDTTGLATEAKQDDIIKSIVGDLAVRIDDADASAVYVGKAPAGSLESEETWQIAKLDTSSGLVKTWADNAGFTQAWVNRSSLTYN